MSYAMPQVLDSRFDDVVASLRAHLRGGVISAQDGEYDQARKVWNGMYDWRRPAAILRCADEADVRQAIRELADVDAPLAIRGGGHHIAGLGGCDGGFVIDLGAMKDARVDAAARRITVGGGATLHELDTAGAQAGLAVPVGVVSETGVAGLTLTGGIGWLTRSHGYACDNLMRANVVTATGEVVTASEDENPELLWGLRGGGGNFGVVTEFEFDAHPHEHVLVATVVYEAEDPDEISRLLEVYRTWSLEAGRGETAWTLIGPAGQQFQEVMPALVGKGIVAFLACSLEVSDEAARRLELLTTAGTPVMASLGPMPLLDLQHLNDGNDAARAGLPRYIKGEMMHTLTDEVIEGLAVRCSALPTSSSFFEMGMLGGAMGDRDELASAVGMRTANYLGGFQMVGEAGGEITEAIEWSREAWHVLNGASAGGAYLNLDNEVDEERVLGSLSAEHGEKLERLSALKRRWDPGNRFRINHNIKPGS